MLNEEQAIKALIYDNVNVTEKNPLKDFMQVIIQLAIFVAILYFSVFITSGIVLKNISKEQQIELENFLSNSTSVKTIPLNEQERARIEKAKNLILKSDPDFPKSSGLDIGVIKHKSKNAVCLPNGTIYITEKLYKTLNTEDKLVFVIAHEMAHYKNRDHLMSLRKSISNSFVIMSLYLFGAEVKNATDLVSSSIDIIDMKYSKAEESRADIYAGKVLLDTYGTTKAGIEVMNILKEGDYDLGFEIMSTHPGHEKRIRNLKNLNEKRK